VDVLVLGDWGTGGSGQKAVAESIARTHADRPPVAILTVGDNVYEHGVDSAEDPRWDEVFRSVYTGPFWDSIPFRPTLGNHDYHKNPDAQVAFSGVEPRWKMPGRYYAFRLALPGGDSALFVAVDTNVRELATEAVEAQHAWLDSLSAAAGSARVITYGHHPVAPTGMRAPPAGTVELLFDFVSNRSDVYLAGHEHVLQLTRPSEGPLQAICGGGGGTDEPYDTGDSPPGTIASFTGGGWCRIRLWDEVAAIELYDLDGTLRHREFFGS
jgi:acid phosphatase